MDDWNAFEKAVAVFVQALEPKAKVIHDAKIPDKDTGLPRQRDVWIETYFGNFLPIKILVSCKYWKSPLDQQDIDAFLGELISAKAHKGVIYSRSGFTEGAIKKSKALGISCCKLYADGAPECPEMLTFTAYNSRECFKFKLAGQWDKETMLLADLLNQEMREGTGRVGEVLSTRHRQNCEFATKGITLGSLPTWSTWLDVKTEPNGNYLRIILEGNWQVYQARLDAWLLNGSYSFSDDRYVGNISTPYIDTQGEHPGPGWDFLGINPSVSADNIINMIFSLGQTEQALLDNFGATKICDFACRDAEY